MKTAIIIGAGPAGLTAAYKLLKETDIVPIILEESEFIGGISRTVYYNSNRMDIGGHRFFSKNPDIMKIWLDLMPLQGSPAFDDLLLNNKKDYVKDGPDPETTDEVSLIRRRVSRIFYLRNFFDYPISLKFQTFKNMGLFRTLKVGFGYTFAVIFKRKEKSLEDFYINRFGNPLYAMFFEDYTEKLWGVHPSKIAPDWGSQRVKGLSITKAILNVLKKPFGNKKKVETSLIEEFMYPKKGPGQLWEKMADEILKMGGEIRFNSKVEKINTLKSNIVGVIANNEEINGDYYFSTMPVKDLINGMNDVPQNINEIATNLPYRDFITVGLLLNKLAIKNKTKFATVSNIVPDCWIYIQERDVKIGRLQIFNNWSPYLVKDVENTVWVGLEYFCTEGDEMWTMTDQDFIEFAIDELVKINIIDKTDVLDSTRIKVKKAYPAYFGTYKDFDVVKGYLNSFTNLFCLGRNGQHRYNNMDHSMLTAMVAVDLIKENSPSKDEIWDVNTEETYHESKNKKTK